MSHFLSVIIRLVTQRLIYSESAEKKFLQALRLQVTLQLTNSIEQRFVEVPYGPVQ